MKTKFKTHVVCSDRRKFFKLNPNGLAMAKSESKKQTRQKWVTLKTIYVSTGILLTAINGGF